jgi:hypothetical protein
MPTLQELIDEINISYACRALLGGGKGLSVMEILRKENPDYYEKIMREARKKVESEAKDGKLP